MQCPTILSVGSGKNCIVYFLIILLLFSANVFVFDFFFSQQASGMYRWVVLILFSLATFSNQLLWITYSPINTIVARLYGVTSIDVDWYVFLVFNMTSNSLYIRGLSAGRLQYI